MLIQIQEALQQDLENCTDSACVAAAQETYLAAIQAADEYLDLQADIRDMKKQIASLKEKTCKKQADRDFLRCFPDGCGDWG